MNTPGSHYDDRVEKQESLKQSNLVFIFNPQWQALLYKKVTSRTNFDIALSKWNWLWGKKDEDDATNEDSALREAKDEGKIVLTKNELEKVWTIRFYFRTKTKYNQECDVYIVKNFTWSYGESDEMKQPTWFDPDKLPLEEMWESDKIRMPKIIHGEKILAAVYHEDDGSLVWGSDGYVPVKSFDELDPNYFSKHPIKS